MASVMHFTRRRTAELLQSGKQGDRLSRALDVFLIALIFTNVLAIILGSVGDIYHNYQQELMLLEVASISAFTIEYFLRIWSCVELEDEYQAPFWGRIRYMFTPMALIDLIAIVPFYLVFFVAMDLRFLRVFRLLRIFKLSRYSGAMGILLSVLTEERQSFLAAFFVLLLLLVLASSGIYLIEQDIQPDAFGSIPAAMWWAMSTLTTVGYGDVTPITAAGKLFGGFITVIGVGMVALPAGILASGFAEQINRRKEEFGELVDHVIEDGVVTLEEEVELEDLRKSLGLSTEEADMLLRAARRELQHNFVNCPHCQQSLHTKLESA